MAYSSLEILKPFTLRQRETGWRTGRWLAHLTLFGLTFLTTTAFGCSVMESFQAGRSLSVDYLFDGYVRLFHLDPAFWTGLYFALPLLLILLAHEFGHFFACRSSRVDSTLPFFLPSPLLLGTFGAFIRIRSPIYSRKVLLNIGISGPLAGFCVLLPFLIAGAYLSRFSSQPVPADNFVFGMPLVMRIAMLICRGIPSAQIIFHPFAMAAWAGLLATAMNLLPIGQLDGGHVLYAVAGERWHRLISTFTIGVLVLLGFAYRAWWGWAVLMFLFGRRHPLVYDTTPVRRPQALLALAGLCVLAVSLAVVPVSIR